MYKSKKKLIKYKKTKKTKKTKKNIQNIQKYKYSGGYTFLIDDDKDYMEQFKNDLITKYNTFYNNALLVNYKDIIASIKILLGLKQNEDIIDTIVNKVIQDDFFQIKTNTQFVDGLQINYHNPNSTNINNDIDVIGSDTVMRPVWGIQMTSQIERLDNIYKELSISHELSHLIEILFLSLTFQELLNIKSNDGNYMFRHKDSKSIKTQELFPDLIAIAIVFIKFRNTELLDINTKITPSETKLTNDLTNKNNVFSTMWGYGDNTHPSYGIRTEYSLNLLTDLTNILDFDVTNPNKINDVRQLTKKHMVLYLANCYTTTSDIVLDFIKNGTLPDGTGIVIKKKTQICELLH